MATALMVLCFVTGCSPADAPRASQPWPASANAVGYREITSAAEVCTDCIELRERVVLGSEQGEGFLQENGEYDGIVIDHAGNYWVGQRGVVKVFDAGGEYLRDVGQLGEGPGDLKRARPVHVDRLGRVHVMDSGNLALNVFGADFAFQERQAIPGLVNTAAPLDDGERYAVQLSTLGGDQSRQPLRIIRGSETLHSFGTIPDEADSRSAFFYSQRRVATDASGHIFSAWPHDYAIEIWGTDGARMDGMRSPGLNDREILPTTWTRENPPANSLADLRADDQGKLWILVQQVQDDWREHVREEEFGGQMILQPIDDDMAALFRSRLDVIDLASATFVASVSLDDSLWVFLADGAIVGPSYTASGDLRLRVFDVGMSR